MDMQWLRWPQNKRREYVPWFITLWRLVWFPMVFIGIGLSWIGIAASHGLSEAKSFWRDVRWV